VQKLIDSVNLVTGSQAAVTAHDIPWQVVAQMHPTRNCFQLCHKWSTLFYLNPELLRARGKEKLPELKLVRIRYFLFCCFCFSCGFFFFFFFCCCCSRYHFSNMWPTWTACILLKSIFATSATSLNAQLQVYVIRSGASASLFATLNCARSPVCF
jgi:hypothetical protein